MATVIEAKGLTKRFGERAAVDGVDLVVPAGVEAQALEIQRPAFRLLRKLPKFGHVLDVTYRDHGLKRTLEDVRQATGPAFSAGYRAVSTSCAALSAAASGRAPRGAATVKRYEGAARVIEVTASYSAACRSAKLRVGWTVAG